MNTLERKSKRQLVEDYIKEHNPYEPSPSLGYNVKEISRYAKEKGCNIAELSEDEIELFKV